MVSRTAKATTTAVAQTLSTSADETIATGMRAASAPMATKRVQGTCSQSDHLKSAFPAR